MNKYIFSWLITSSISSSNSRFTALSSPIENHFYEHRLLVEAVAMTGADLSATSKPWNLQMRTVTTLYEEFYDQGDREMQSGRVPVPVMNRTYIDQQALHQVIILDVHLCIYVFDVQLMMPFW